MNALVKSLIKHLTEIVTATEVICDKCGWRWDLADGGNDPYICHSPGCGHDNTPPNLDEKVGSAIPYGSGFTPYKKNNLNELGEGDSEPFKWKATKDIKSYILDQKELSPEYASSQLNYLFSSDKANYEVNIFTSVIPSSELTDKRPSLYIAVGFDIVGGKGESTNLNELYRIMATVLEIIVDFVNTVDAMDDINLKQIQVFPISDQSINISSINSKRGKLYEEYIKKNLDKFNKKYTFTSHPDGRSFVIKPAYTFSIKENQTKAWDLKEGIVYLSKYMLDNGLKVKPLPKIKFIKDDEENASNMLGKTAYYNPAEKSITLYTFSRHPKDILRSFSHEMIHHMQNLDGRLNNITTTNTNEDGDLPELEREAYEKGNMMLRNWEDSLNK
jgi:hypothetical protein